MSRSLRRLSIALLVASWACSAAPRAEAAKIDADPKKVYTISKAHGPWMIMVTSLRGETDEQKKNASKAAHALVLELRRKGIPAYLFSQKGDIDEIEALDKSGQQAKRFVAAHRDRVCILAGNYPSLEDETAQQTLKFIKDWAPDALREGVYRATPGRKMPLSRAFLTRNPLREDDGEAMVVKDPLLRQLNADRDYNLLDNKGRYSLVVASFYGKSQTHILNPGKTQAKEPAAFQEFDKKLRQGSMLDQAGMNSWELVRAMRNQGIEAYVYHERYRSIVTVGAFDSPTDPRIAPLLEKFRAKPNPEQGSLVAETIQVPGRDPNGPPLRHWIMDPQPKVIPVPILK